jgi:hypothetical protein
MSVTELGTLEYTRCELQAQNYTYVGEFVACHMLRVTKVKSDLTPTKSRVGHPPAKVLPLQKSQLSLLPQTCQLKSELAPTNHGVSHSRAIVPYQENLLLKFMTRQLKSELAPTNHGASHSQAIVPYEEDLPLIPKTRHTYQELCCNVPFAPSQFDGMTHEQIVAYILRVNELQAEERGPSSADVEWAKLMQYIQRASDGIRKTFTIPGYDGGFTEILEGFIILTHWHQYCNNLNDYYTLARTAYMCFTGKSLIDRVIRHFLFPDEVQSFEEIIEAMRRSFDLATAVTECGIMTRLRKMYTYLLVQGVLSKMGMEISDEEFAYLNKKKSSLKYGSKFNMWCHAVDTAIYICERLISFRKTGRVESFFQDGTECEMWLVEADRLLTLAPFTANLEPHGTTYFRFLSDLGDAIDKGQGYTKAMRALGAERSNPVLRKLGSLLLLKNAEVTKRASQEYREAPFGVLVYGHSGVAKSSFMRVLFHAFGSIFSLERDDHYLYTRSPTSEYWTNFDTSMWAIQMDDIAFVKPSKTADIDPTLKELLNVVNNVPFNPPQADLSDKGKTPVRAKLVLATTNCEDLNANEYFYCPLAARRRLPYVIEVCPKQGMYHANGVFIDPKKMNLVTGFPSYWHIVVKEIVPVIEADGTERARLAVVAEFDDIMSFIKHYAAAAKQHFVNQEKSSAQEALVKQVELCPVCVSYVEDCVCNTQVDVAGMREFIVYYMTWVYMASLKWWFEFHYVHIVCSWFAKVDVLKRLMMRYMIAYLPANSFVRFMARLGERVQDRRMRMGIVFLTLLSTGLAIYGFSKRNKKKDLTSQGNVFGTTEQDLPKESKENVWHRDEVELMQFQLPLASGSLVGKKPEQLRDMFANNVVSLKIEDLDGNYKGATRGFFYRGNALCLNKHTLKGERFRITVLRGLKQQGTIPAVAFEVVRTDFVFNDGLDLAMIMVPCMPPQRDLSKFWSEETMPFSKMVGIGRLKDGTVDLRSVWAVAKFMMPLKGLIGEFPVLSGTSDVETQNGDCGTLYLAETPRGFTFVGMHVAGYGVKTGAIHLLRKDLEEIYKGISNVGRSVSGEGAPMLNLQGTQVDLLPIHEKSVFRFIEKGSCDLYGRLPGFLPKPRSKVTSTPLRLEMEKFYRIECNYTKPAMVGWAPIRNNVKEMVIPKVNYDRGILLQCKKGFLTDILANLPDRWEAQIHEFSDIAAVNGIPGVKFIDRINTNSSMGFPWNKTKKQFLEDCISERYPQGVDFPENIWEKVREVEAAYALGQRAYPVFMGHLKDEPVTLAKRAIEKTRLFAGGPIHWSLVVRKTLLSFVKLVQENKYVFEAGPGTVCQSLEWQQMREYLTKFGEDRIVAGDYSKFDKHMIADFIIAAYEIIADLHRVAGFDEQYARKIMAIGTDTAYPLMNIRGELVMFYGTNPSGHPLTVIINSLVNSLYMRYAYVKLGYEAATFKENVALMTYGDDNVMGVSPRAPRFMHTNIQHELEVIGVTYTMADKESESVPYININDVAFLKRKWRYDGDIGAFVCPLDEDSIQKSLMCWLPSTTLVPEQQIVFVIQSAVNEYFWYGREKFEEMRTFFMELTQQEPYTFYVTDSTYPTWQELYDRFWDNSKC